MFGIIGLQLYVPNSFVDQAQLEIFDGAPKGKHTIGLGQLQLSFAYPFEDVNSLCLNAVANLMKHYSISPAQIGHLEVGTETLIDKSKSSKTVLMTLFQGHHDIEGATSINACYGGTNALLNTLNWISAPTWDGRYGIVVAADIAVYQKGSARCTGGAGAVAMLIGPNAPIVINPERASFMDHQYDFYKPNPHSEYPTVDGKNSMESYLNAMEQCYKALKLKVKRNILDQSDYFCFHSPFHKMVQKAFARLTRLQNPRVSDENLKELFGEKVQPCMEIPQRTGNIYTGSLYSALISLLVSKKPLENRRVLMFSYGSGLCSTMFSLTIRENVFNEKKVQSVLKRIENRLKIDPSQYDRVMREKEANYGKPNQQFQVPPGYLRPGSYYLSGIDELWRRKYSMFEGESARTGLLLATKNMSSMGRLVSLDKRMTDGPQKFYRLSLNERLQKVVARLSNQIDKQVPLTGGLSLTSADSMVENAIGLLSLPLGVIPSFTVNHQEYIVPMCIEEPSVIAACSSVGQFLKPYSFFASSTPNIMIGQVHLPSTDVEQTHIILSKKEEIIKLLNQSCCSMAKRGGGVTDIQVRQLNDSNAREYVVEILVNVCEAMGANMVNTCCEIAKEYISSMGIPTGIAILSNYCTERVAMGWFQVPVSSLSRNNASGKEVAMKLLQAYSFACNDQHRATTHNKGIMNGIDAVCLATGQDWRAIEAAAHSYASRKGKYKPLTHYELINQNGIDYLRGTLKLPIAVGCVGGAVQKNPSYKVSMAILGNPTASKLSQILVCVGLAQNFAALRALATEGIQKGHMRLHAKSLALSEGVPAHLLDQVCEHMHRQKQYNKQAIEEFMKAYLMPKL